MMGRESSGRIVVHVVGGGVIERRLRETIEVSLDRAVHPADSSGDGSLDRGLSGANCRLPCEIQVSFFDKYALFAARGQSVKLVAYFWRQARGLRCVFKWLFSCQIVRGRVVNWRWFW